MRSLQSGENNWPQDIFLESEIVAFAMTTLRHEPISLDD